MAVTVTDSGVAEIPKKAEPHENYIQFPSGLMSDQHASSLMFYAVRAMPREGSLSNASLDERGIGAVTGRFNEQTICMINLPMTTHNENTSHAYDTNDGGFIQDLVTNYDATMAGKSGFDVAAAGKSFIDTSIQAMSVQIDRAKQEYNAQVSGSVLGSRSAAMYKNSEPRQHTFRYQLRPKNLSELKQVGRILRDFQVYSAATNHAVSSMIGGETDLSWGDKSLGTWGGTITGDGLSRYNKLEVPPLWFVEELIHDRDKLRFTPKFAFGPAAIISVRIDKTPDQVYQTFKQSAGDPVAIDLEITMQELRPMYADYYKAVSSKLGQQDVGGLNFQSFV
ncbi:TPA: baseplate tail-tube junction protein [Vibrio vulnificus]